MTIPRFFALATITVSLASLLPACAASSSDAATASGDTGDEQDLRAVKHCGGIAGLACGAGQSCVDDPIDSCDPANGGRDCAGICVDAATAPTCGGIAGLACPSGLKCVDRPNDGCDPAHGGADCAGICVKAACDASLALTTTCPSGTAFDTQKCACLPPPSHPTCATLSCAAGYHCEEKGINGGSIPVCIRDDKTDCRSTGCAANKSCSACWGTFACIPKGAMC